MAGAKRKQRRKNTIVRGPDGGLYLLGGAGAPRKLTPNEAQKLTKILQDTEDDVSDRVKTQIPTMVEPCIFLVHSQSE
jgi:hypothetical protein